jgi:hypothetical protein
LTVDAQTFDSIIADVAAGEAAYKALRAHGSNYRAFYGEIGRNPESREKYARAKADGMDRLADEICELADEALPINEEIAKARLQIDSRKWLLSKLAPKKYGEKVDLTHAGPDGGPILTEVRRIIVRPGNTDA